jgi:hypothetical protein
MVYSEETGHHVERCTEAGEEHGLVGGDHPLATSLYAKIVSVWPIVLLSPCARVRDVSWIVLMTLRPRHIHSCPSSFVWRLRTFSQVLRPSCFWNSRW